MLRKESKVVPEGNVPVHQQDKFGSYIYIYFVGQRVRAVPVGDPLKQKAALLREGFLPEEIRGAFQAWNFLDSALQSKEDRAILKRCRSSR